MKSKKELLHILVNMLEEIEHYQRYDTDMLQTASYIALQDRLEFLYDILGNDVPKKYWERIEDAIYYEYQ